METAGECILVVDDEPKIVDVVKSYLENSGYSVCGAYTGKEALVKFEKGSFSLLILDWMLPDVTGEEICRTIRQKSDVPVIMLTARAAEENILQGFKFGADDYVTKPFSPRQLVARAEAVLRRSRAGASSVFSFCGGDLTVDLSSREVKKSGNPVNLTPNEFKIIRTFVRHPKKVYTREELLAAMSENDFDGYDRVIDTHIKNIRQKIETDPKNPRYILTVFGVGYRFGGS